MKKKMSLNDLKVISFVTNLENDTEQTIKAVGGARSLIATDLCPSRLTCNTCNDTCQPGCGATNDCPPPRTQYCSFGPCSGVVRCP